MMRQDARMRPIVGRNLDTHNTRVGCAHIASGLVAIGNAMLRSVRQDDNSPACRVIARRNCVDIFEQLIKFNIIYFYDVEKFAPMLDEIMSSSWADESSIRPIGDGQGFIVNWTRGNVAGEVLLKSLDCFCGGDSFSDACRRYLVPSRVVDKTSPADLAIAGVYRLRKLLRAVREEYRNRFGIDPLSRRIWTLSGYAFQAYRRTLPKPLQNPVGRDSNESRAMEQFMRSAYRGAFVECRCDSQLTNLEGWDVNGMYAFACDAIRFPTGPGFWTQDFPEWRRMVRVVPGFAEVTIRSRSETCITKRLRGGDVVRTRSTRGIFTSFEILHAQRDGARVTFHRGLFFLQHDRSRSLQKFMQKCMHLKYAAPEGSGGRQAGKSLANVLTGKLGQKIAWPRQTYHYSSTPPAEGECEEIREGECYKTLLEEIPDARTTFRAWPGWAALITAFARIYLIEQRDVTRSVYSDTDFVVPLATPASFLLNTSPVANYASVGYFTLRDEFPLVRFARKKCYAWENPDGIIRARWAGKHAPNLAEKQELLAGELLPPRLPVPLDCLLRVQDAVTRVSTRMPTPPCDMSACSISTPRAQNGIG